MAYYLPQNIRLLRKKYGYTQMFLGKLLHKHFTTIQRWETGEIDPTVCMVLKMAEIFGVKIDTFINKDLAVERVDALTSHEYKYIPSPVAAGISKDFEGLEEFPTLLLPDVIMGRFSKRKDMIIMHVKGESMNRVLKSGSLIGVVTEITPKDLIDGDIVVFNHDNDYSIKQFFRTDEILIFRPNSTNHSFTDIVYNMNDPVEILGKVVMYNVLLS